MVREELVHQEGKNDEVSNRTIVKQKAKRERRGEKLGESVSWKSATGLPFCFTSGQERPMTEVTAAPGCNSVKERGMVGWNWMAPGEREVKAKVGERLRGNEGAGYRPWQVPVVETRKERTPAAGYC